MSSFDPRVDVGALSDDAPVVLLPLRIETRFRPSRLRPRRSPELWVRVFPDACWIDTHTAERTTTEFESTRRYWRSRFSSPDERGVRDAWQVLVAAHGAGRSSYLTESWQPTSLAEVDAADPADFVGRETSWSTAACLHSFPQRLRLIGVRGGVVELDELGELIPEPLVVGPDPAAPTSSALHIDDTGQLVVPDELRWLVDFSAAVKVGMGFRVRLTTDQAREGFDRLFVLGVRVGGDHHDGAKALTGLIERHRWSTPGFELLPQGCPTNNTEGMPSAFRRFDDPAVTFTAAHRTSAPAIDPADWRHKPDGQWFTELLGLEPETATHLVNAEASDQIEGRAMSRLLWPATLGYYLDAMLASSAPGRRGEGVLSRRSESMLRDWATRYVVGRGALPAIRIGRQPYGLVTTTAFSRLSWTTHGPVVADREAMPFVAGVHRTVEVMRRDWMAMTSRVSHLGGSGDVAEQLASVLGLQPSSVQFHQRHADQADRQTVLLGYISAELMQRHRAFVATMADTSMELLESLGARLAAPPEVLTKLFVGGANRLDGPVVDDVALSETDSLRVDYLAWLHEAASSSLDVLRSGEGLDPRPRALLFLLAKFALERAYAEVADDLLIRGGVDPAAVLARRVEPSFVHLGATGASESRWRPLYEPAPQITSDDRVPLHRFITRELRRGRLSGSGLGDQLDALDSLRVPTARLERAFVEHLDTCSYRLDAWLGGLVGFQLQQMRFPVPTRPPRVGAHLGAYGWLENVRPRTRALERVTITDRDVAETYRESGGTAVMSDPTNGGFVAAPTLDHAATAAVLRAGYLSAADSANPGPLAVNLSSDRVRRAQQLLEGVRAGQSLGALLGYQLERGLHDRHDLPELHTAIYALRLAFPLRANRLGETAAVAGEPAEVVEARNVVDGVRLCDHVRAGGALPPMAAALAAAVSDEVDRLFDVYDAVSDLALAEGVHQLVLGNHERAAAMLDAFGRSGLPPEPDVIRTPRNGYAISHRLVVHLDPDASPGPTPRSAAAAGVDAWLGAVLPPGDRVGCRVRAIHPESGTVIERTVTQADLGWQPVDLLEHLDVEADQVMTVLDDAVVEHVVRSLGLRPDAQLSIDHTAEIEGHTTFFQLAPVVRNLRSLLLKPTVLGPTDLMAPGEEASAVPTSSLERQRVAGPLDELSQLRASIEAALDAIDTDATAAAVEIDTTVATVLSLSAQANRFGIGTGGSGQLRAAFGHVFGQVVAAATATASQISGRLARFDVGLAEFDALPPSTDATTRLGRLVELERLVSTVATHPLPAVAAMRAIVVAERGVLAAAPRHHRRVCIRPGRRFDHSLRR